MIQYAVRRLPSAQAAAAMCMSTWMSPNGQCNAPDSVRSISPRGDELRGILMHTLHVASETACKLAHADDTAVLLQRMHDCPAPFGQASEEAGRRLEVQQVCCQSRQQ
jgi:hypothetical protein